MSANVITGATLYALLQQYYPDLLRHDRVDGYWRGDDGRRGGLDVQAGADDGEHAQQHLLHLLPQHGVQPGRGPDHPLVSELWAWGLGLGLMGADGFSSHGYGMWTD